MLYLMTLLLFCNSSLAANESPAPLSLPSFKDTWKTIVSHSPSLKSDEKMMEAKRTLSSRMARHWFPTLSLDARAFQTTEPGLTLFSKLSSSSLGGRDLAPYPMNYPEALAVERLTLGVYLPLFEGGAREAQAIYAKKDSESYKAASVQRKTELFSKAALLYGSLITQINSSKDLKQVRTQIQNTIENYKIGAQSNPLGYSGLLGLRNLHKRLDGAFIELDSSIQTQLMTLGEMMGTPPPLPPPASYDSDISAFIRTEIPEPSGHSDSSTIQALNLSAEGLSELAEAERSKFVPHLGLFSEGYYTTTQAGSATSYTAGAYLKWDILSAQHWGSIKQNRLQAEAQFLQVSALRERQRIEFKRLSENSRALENQLQLALQSKELLNEQLQIALKLFKTGALNALQLSEVFAKRIELIGAISQLEAALLKTRVDLLEHMSRDQQTLLVSN